MAQLYLIRHGQTDWNAERRFQGSKDVPLNETGRQQAAQAAKELEAVPFNAIYSSHLTRAKETAEILRGKRSHLIHILEDLREGSFGSLEGQSYSKGSLWEDLAHLSFEQRLHHKWVDDQESAYEVVSRVVPCLTQIATQHLGQPVLVVTHGGVIRTLLAVLEGRRWETIQIRNTQVLVFELGADKTLKLLPSYSQAALNSTPTFPKTRSS